MNTEKHPLITIVVVTYNSSRFVNETLASILAQTYTGPVEVLISDDHSTDDTPQLCRSWVETHRHRFSRAEFIYPPTHSGICGNYNFALQHARGEWIKYIAGDDILTPCCIECFANHAADSDDRLLISGVICIDEDGSIIGPRYMMQDYLDTADPYEQAVNLAYHCGGGIVEGPAFFIHTQTLRDLGGMDMRYPMLEDFPFAFRYALSGRHIGVVKEPLVKYRIHPQSVSQSSSRFARQYDRAKYDARMQIALLQHNYLLWWHHRIMRTVSQSDNHSPLVRCRNLLLKLSDIYAMTVFAKTQLCHKVSRHVSKSDTVYKSETTDLHP